jgi:hypothetical protein
MRVSAHRVKSSARRVADLLHGRSGYRLESPWGHVEILEGGGHICGLRLNACREINPLWIPPWKTMDPERYSVRRHSKLYGPLPDGRLLAGIAGHNLSFDYFGPPSTEEIAAGHSTHGEAPSLQWKMEAIGKSAGISLRYGVRLPKGQIRFTRTISLDSEWPVIYCEEQATNLSTFDRPISWNEHVTFGPPFVEPGVTVFDMPATHAKACSPSYSSRPLIKPDAEFRWPSAPAIKGGTLNLRTIPEARCEHYTAQLLDPAATIAFTSACNPRFGLLVVYAFRRADFPWVGRWVERFHQSQAPWSKKTFCCGIEFSSTPFAIPRRQSIDQSRLFAEKTYRWLPAKSTVAVRFMTLLFKVPGDFRGVHDVSIASHTARIVEMGPQPRLLRTRTRAFL